MEYIAIFILGFFVGVIYTINAIRKQVLKIVNSLETEFLDKTPKEKTAPILFLEKHGSTYYLFDKQTDAFLCQSNDLNDLGTKLLKYKNITVAFVQGDKEQSFWYVNGKVTTGPQ